MNDADTDGATPLDPDESKGLKLKHITTKGELNELEQANIEQGVEWLSGRTDLDVFDDAFIRELHKRLFGAVWTWAGKYRQTEKNIGVSASQVPTQLRQLLDDARHWSQNNVFPPLEAAAYFHHRMVQIHPFPNGNGRHARIATDFMLRQAYDHPPIDWAAGYDLQVESKRRTNYIAALRAADANDYEPLFAFMGLAPSKTSGAHLERRS